MHPGRAVCAYFCFIFLGGALLAPWIYMLVGLANTVSPLFQPFASQPFHRFVSRSFIVLGILGLWPFLRSIGVRSWSGAGLKQTGRWPRELATGLGLGFFSLLIAASTAVLTGGRILNLPFSSASLWKHLLNATLAAIAASFIEELFFRGVIFGALRRRHTWMASLLVSSAIYAILHFFERPEMPERIEWHTGLTTLASMSAGLIDVPRLVPGFFTLALAGCILGLAYQRTGSLAFSMGLHAGWIFWLKSYGFLTRERAGASQWLWGSGKLIDGWMAFVVLAAVFLIALKWLRPRPRHVLDPSDI